MRYTNVSGDLSSFINLSPFSEKEKTINDISSGIPVFTTDS